MRMRECMYNSGALWQQRAMSFSYWAASLDRSRRADLCQLKVSEWHICISKPITETLWITLGIHEFNRENGSLPVVLRHSKTPFLKPRTNGRNIVGQQLPTLLDVTCCVRLHTLLHVLGCCCAKFETGQTFQPTTPNISFVPWSPKRSATMLDSFALLFVHCWGRARLLRMVYKDLWVASFPRCKQWRNNVGSCCVRLHAVLGIFRINLHMPLSFITQGYQ